MVLALHESPHLDQSGFAVIADLVFRSAGIKLGPDKRLMVQTRLLRRLRHLQMPAFKDYVSLITSRTAVELPHLLDAVTTNKTEFFRERPHFDHLIERAFSAWHDGEGPIRILSAGCSSGEEPYTIAMCAIEALGPGAGKEVRIDAGDLSQIKLSEARRGVYPVHEVAHLGRSRLHRHFLKGQNQCDGLVKIRPEVSALVFFERINLIHSLPYAYQFHAVFCCNVAIYFDQETQDRVFTHLHQVLRPGGFLFLGHAESLRPGNSLPFRPLRPAAYLRD